MNAFVLAGGRSTRMGRDKALLELDGRPLIEHALVKLRALRLSPRIVGSRDDLSGFAPVVADNFPHAGPLGGMEAALAASHEDLNLFLPVDLPWLPVEFLRLMMERAERTNALATVPLAQGLPQPLCAVYSRALLPHVRAALAGGNAKVTSGVEQAAAATGLRIDSFDAESIAASQLWEQRLPVYRWFQNLNSPEDFERALEQSRRIP